MTSDDGITLIKALEEFMDQKQIIFATDIINLFLSVTIFTIYAARTYLMCKFDSDPIWRLPATSSGPNPIDKAPFINKNGEYTEKDEMNHFFPSDDCQGELHVYYYTFLAISHAYFLIEFFLRFLCAKAKYNFIMEIDSIIEIFTTVPFFMLWATLGKDNYFFQLFICMDGMRLLLYDRYIKNIK